MALAPFIHPFFMIIYAVLSLFYYILIIDVVMSWLLSFGVISMKNDLVRMVWNGVEGLCEPALRPLRRFLPSLGGMDFSPLVLLLILQFASMELGAIEGALLG